jgi:hypothetical protein
MFWSKKAKSEPTLTGWVKELCVALESGAFKPEIKEETKSLLFLGAVCSKGVNVWICVEKKWYELINMGLHSFTAPPPYVNVAFNSVDACGLSYDDKVALWKASTKYAKNIHQTRFAKELGKLVLPIVQESKPEKKRGK